VFVYRVFTTLMAMAIIVVDV